MKIAIIGGGITGLTAAYEFLKKGHQVTVFEKESYLGGLAYGFKQPNWQWHVEGAYHHLFTNDAAILTLAKRLGIGDKLITKRPITSNLLPPISKLSFDSPKGVRTAQLDGPIQLFQFPGLSISDKIRTSALVAFCKVYPFWKTLEKVTAKQFFTLWGGKRAWEIIWEPLMTGKFGHLDSTIAASWLWARIHKRTPSLVYFEGGFQTFVNTLTESIRNSGGTVITGIAIDSIQNISRSAYTVSWNAQNKKEQYAIQNTKYDKVLFTTPTPIANKILPGIASPESLTIPHLHAQVLILETKQPILEKIYWLSITDRSFPFLAVVAHTNFMDKKHYGNNHITYIGNYLPNDHRYLKMTKEQLEKEFMPFIQRITNTDVRITNSYLFTAPFAQPVHQKNYSTLAPKLKTTVSNIFLANMDSIVPWDRGTNYAVKLGIDAATAILASDSTQ